jgi:hypothetical protein
VAARSLGPVEAAHGVAQQVDLVDQRLVDDLLGGGRPRLEVGLHRDVELVTLEVTALPEPVGGRRQDARTDVVEHRLDVGIEVLAEQFLRVGTVARREFPRTGLVNDTDGSQVDQFTAQALDRKALDPL